VPVVPLYIIKVATTDEGKNATLAPEGRMMATQKTRHTHRKDKTEGMYQN